MIKGIIFDIDGVLLDSRNALYQYYKDLFMRFGFKKLKKEEVMKFHGYSRKDWIHALLPRNEKRNKRLINEMNHIGLRMYGPYYLPRYARLFGNTISMLKRLKKKYKLAIATNNTKRDTEIILKKFNLKGIFDVIITANDVKRPKPSPELLILAVDEMGIPKEDLIYVGDSEVDVKTGKSAGIKTVLISKKKTRIKPNYQISCLTELKKILDL
jgi:phosphoglycolate phosphatase-like HAD superfamily hydrolase